MKAGDQIETTRSGWKFSGEVAKNFDEHVSKSVPFYSESHQIICGISEFFVRDGCTYIDLGCSTGRLIEEIGRRHEAKKGITAYGYDVEEDMLTQATQRLLREKNMEIELRSSAFLEMDPINAAFITCVYTLQFVRPFERQMYVDKIYKQLEWGGGFVLFEKVRGPDARFQDIYNTMYSEFKLSQGYSEKEVIGKMLSLKGVLEPFSTSGNIGLLERAGFRDIVPVFQYLCFQGLLAIK